MPENELADLTIDLVVQKHLVRPAIRRLPVKIRRKPYLDKFIAYHGTQQGLRELDVNGHG